MKDDSDTPQCSAETNGRLSSVRGWIGSLGMLLLTVLVVTSLTVGFVTIGTSEANAQVGFSTGDVDLEVFVADNTFTPGQTTTVDLQIVNNAEVGDGSAANLIERTTTARNVRVELDEQQAPISIETGKQSVGSINLREPRTVPIEIEIPDSAEPGEYELEVELEYRQTDGVFDSGGTRGDTSESVTRDVTIVIDDGARFELRSAETQAQVGDTGQMTAEIENVGGERAEDLQVELTSASQRVDFGGAASETAAVTALEPGETATLEYDVAFGDGASVRGYPLTAAVTFEDTDGITEVDETSFDVTPQAEQTFVIENTESTLRVGEEGDLSGTVQNTGPETVRSLVVQYSGDSENIVPVETEVAVGTLEPGETSEFTLPIEVTGEAKPVARTVDLTVQYRNVDNERRSYSRVDAIAEVSQQRDEFLVNFANKDLSAGEGRQMNVEVTNNLDQPVTDIEARLFTDDPLDSADDEGYVESLDPGESTTITFQLTAAGSATAKTHPVSLDFRYDDADGDSQISDTSRLAVAVTESEDGSSLSLVIGLVGLIVVVIGGVGVGYRRRT